MKEWKGLLPRLTGRNQLWAPKKVQNDEFQDKTKEKSQNQESAKAIDFKLISTMLKATKNISTSLFFFFDEGIH